MRFGSINRGNAMEGLACLGRRTSGGSNENVNNCSARQRSAQQQ